MIARAQARYVRVSPRKTRQVIDLIRGQDAQRALASLGAINKVAAYHVAKVLKSAIANAKQTPEAKPEELYISKIVVDGGPMLKRFRASAMGRATRILKRTCHITVELDRRPKVVEPKEKKVRMKRRWVVSKPPTRGRRKRGS